MFKKTLAAVAVLGAFAGSAFAANVTMYGVIDTGFGYSYKDAGYGDNTHKFEMATGQNSGVRFGLKGEEELGNGLKVGFVLENGFNSDDGQLANNGRLFGREALLYVNGAFGELGMGRQGELASGNGRYGIFGGGVSPFSTGWTNIAGHKYVMGAGFDRMDNTVTYKTPTFAGVNVLAQYSFKKDNKSKAYGSAYADSDAYKDLTAEAKKAWKDQREGSSGVDRQYAVGVSYKAGDLFLSGVVTQTNVATSGNGAKADADDPLTVSLGGNYNFGVATVYVAGQYFKDSALAVAAVQSKNAGSKFDGFGVSVGTAVPVFGGTAKALVGYMNAEDQVAAAMDMQRYTFSLGYEYPLSKRTFVYAGAGYYMDSYDKTAGAAYDDKASVIAVDCGLVHKF